MKDIRIILLLFLTMLVDCSDCRDDDCGGDDFITIQVIGDSGTDYTDSLAFYYYDESQQKKAAEIHRDRPMSQRYNAYLDYRGAEPANAFYLVLGTQTKTIIIRTRYDQDPCCGDYLRFEEARVDGQAVTLPIVLIAG